VNDIILNLLLCTTFRQNRLTRLASIRLQLLDVKRTWWNSTTQDSSKSVHW